ncbi:hypothetical protein NW768_007879 [Fusarium equiseti]|uniref:Uncharacterized protein n=1 Tax=Fusarium equiseti TaxID=61235 RepID=A0ABQ8R913_FUSEQ|nr:hypothetical protein NW768_007879 [Fusarium equiseti]
MTALTTVGNKSHLESTDPWSIKEDRQAGIFAWVIIGIVLNAFIMLIICDMIKKFQTGELQEETHTLGRIFGHLLTLPCRLCTRDNIMPIWYSITNKFQPLKKPHHWKTKEELEKEAKEEEEVKAGIKEPLNSEDSIARLGGGWPPRNHQGSSNRKGRSLEIQRLPSIAKLSEENIGLPRMGGRPHSFRIPEIVPSSLSGDVFQLTAVPVSGSGADSPSQVTVIFKAESSQDQRRRSICSQAESSMVVETGGEKEASSEKKSSVEDDAGEKETNSVEDAEFENETSAKDGESPSREKAGESRGAQQN